MTRPVPPPVPKSQLEAAPAAKISQLYPHPPVPVNKRQAATLEEIINFYKQAMTAKGWEPGIAM